MSRYFGLEARVVTLAGALVVVVAGCSAALPAFAPAATSTAAGSDEARGRVMAEALCRAHGGAGWRERWRRIGGVRAHVAITDPLGMYPADGAWLLDPARNRAVVRFWSPRGAAVEWRYDGARATILRDGACASTPGQRRLTAGLMSNFLYWFGVPYKFLDEGAHPRDAGAGRLLVTYRGVGETPDDWFLAEPEDGRIARITYISSVLSRHLRFVGEFGGYRDFGGLAIATARSFGARSPAARALLAPVEHHFLEVAIGLPLDDANFAAPPGCDP